MATWSVLTNCYRLVHQANTDSGGLYFPLKVFRLNIRAIKSQLFKMSQCFVKCRLVSPQRDFPRRHTCKTSHPRASTSAKLPRADNGQCYAYFPSNHPPQEVFKSWVVENVTTKNIISEKRTRRKRKVTDRSKGQMNSQKCRRGGR